MFTPTRSVSQSAFAYGTRASRSTIGDPSSSARNMSYPVEGHRAGPATAGVPADGLGAHRRPREKREGGAPWQWHGCLAGLSGMIRETRPRSPLVPQVWLERRRAHSLTRQWPLDLLQRATVVAIEDKTRTDRDEGLKARPKTGLVARIRAARSPCRCTPCQPRGRVPDMEKQPLSWAPGDPALQQRPRAHLIRFPCDAALITWALTVVLTLALTLKLVCSAPVTPPMRRLK